MNIFGLRQFRQQAGGNAGSTPIPPPPLPNGYFAIPRESIYTPEMFGYDAFGPPMIPLHPIYSAGAGYTPPIQTSSSQQDEPVPSVQEAVQMLQEQLPEGYEGFRTQPDAQGGHYTFGTNSQGSMLTYSFRPSNNPANPFDISSLYERHMVYHFDEAGNFRGETYINPMSPPNFSLATSSPLPGNTRAASFALNEALDLEIAEFQDADGELVPLTGPDSRPDSGNGGDHVYLAGDGNTIEAPDSAPAHELLGDENGGSPAHSPGSGPVSLNPESPEIPEPSSTVESAPGQENSESPATSNPSTESPEKPETPPPGQRVPTED